MASYYDEFMKTQPYLPLDMGGRLTEAMIVKAKEELGETEEVRAKTIPELRRLVQAEPGLICPTDDAYLLQFLRARKFNVQKALALLKNFYEVKKSNDDIYGSFDEEVLRKALDQKIAFLLPYRDEDGCAVGVIKMRNWDVDVTSASDGIHCLTGGPLIIALEPANQVCGIKLIVDVRGASLKQVRSLIPRHLILLAKAFTNAIPLRFKGFHIYNESPIYQHMFSILKLFLTEKIKNRIHLHGKSQKHLQKYIPKAILPAEDFGGDNPNDVAALFNPQVEKHYEMFHQMTTYGYRQ